MYSLPDTRSLPLNLYISIVMERRSLPGDRWGSQRWRALGAVANAEPPNEGPQCRLIRAGTAAEQYLWSGFRLELMRSEAEAYYYNLLGNQPSVFVVCREEEGGGLKPFMVLLSHYEADAYMEAGDTVFALPMPPPIYRWLEAFVVANYVPEERKGRKGGNKRESGYGKD